MFVLYFKEHSRYIPGKTEEILRIIRPSSEPDTLKYRHVTLMGVYQMLFLYSLAWGNNTYGSLDYSADIITPWCGLKNTLGILLYSKEYVFAI